MTTTDPKPVAAPGPGDPNAPPTRMSLQYEPCLIEIEAIRQTHAEGEGSDAGDLDDEVFDIVITNERPLRRWFGTLTLSHEEGAIDMAYAKGGLSLLLEHGNYPRTGQVDPALHIGIVDDFRLEGKKTKGTMRFSAHALAQQVKQEVKDRTRRYISVGQLPLKLKQTKVASGPEEQNEYLAVKWQPQEVSIVSVPADPKAMVVGQSAGHQEYPVEVERIVTQAEEPSMSVTTSPTAAAPGVAAPAPGTQLEPHSAGGGAGQPATAGAPNDLDRAARIVELCNSHGMQAQAAEYIRAGHSVDAVGRMILEKKGGEQKTVAPRSAEELGASKKDLRRYSYTRAALMASEIREGRRQSFDGVEAEISQGIEQALPATVQRHGGLLLPLRLERPDDEPRRQTHAMGTGVAGGGAELVFDRPGELIDLLRNTAYLMRMGAQVFTGLTQPIQYPKQTGDPTVVWMSENPASGAAASQLNFSTINLSPKTMIGTVPFPRQLLNLSNFDVEAAIRNSLMAQHGLVIDRAGIHGKSTDGQPTGLYNTPGVATVAFGGVASWDKLVDMETAVTQNNAFAQAMAYLATPGVRGRLKKTLRAAAAGSDMIWEGKGLEGEVAGWPAYATNQVSRTMSGLLDAGGSEHGTVFGDWSQLIMAFWGAMELLSDPLTQAGKGQVILTTFQMGDIGCARPEAFCLATGQTA